VELYELKSTAHSHFDRARSLLKGLQSTSLHAKYLVIDQRWVYTGSANLDPRSRRLNTEIGVMIDSPELAAAVLNLFTQSIRSENSYRLSFQQGSLRWQTKEGRREIQYNNEPKSSFWKRLLVRLIGLLPAENLL
ncbi:MAG: phospholipase D-like domain-containing protein, partial [Gammaproteobacteria bacterium]|nr:phospholipase D-like domain-containing protein [Gammaproteobacteria bacterium]